MLLEPSHASLYVRRSQYRVRNGLGRHCWYYVMLAAYYVPAEIQLTHSFRTQLLKITSVCQRSCCSPHLRHDSASISHCLMTALWRSGRHLLWSLLPLNWESFSALTRLPSLYKILIVSHFITIEMYLTFQLWDDTLQVWIYLWSRI